MEFSSPGEQAPCTSRRPMAQFTPTSIESLPPELLIQIFSLSCILSPLSLVPLTVASVSRRWHTIAHTSPQVWQYLVLSDRSSSASFFADPRDERSIRDFSWKQASLWMKRSKPLLMDIELVISDSDIILPLLSPLVGEIHRWGRLVISGKEVNFPKSIVRSNSDIYFSVKSATLGHLTVEIQDRPGDIDDEAGDIHRIGSCPTLTFLPWQPKLSLHLWSSRLSPHYLLSPLPISSLRVFDNAFHNRIPPLDLLEFLAACPNLDTLSFIGSPFADAPLPRRPKVVRLNQLKSLNIRSTCSARTLLTFICTPRLNRLTLGHLNVDFELPHPLASFSYLSTHPESLAPPSDYSRSHFIHEEEGDSEDEAQDFSQSPWSDQSTGMGLRSLLNRSRPPLVRLDMDYTDMRTKDFKWAFGFGTLDALEEFRIVASDMSDRVVRMLGLCVGREMRRRRGNACVDRSGEEGSSGWARLRVRLPRLRSLELINCQQITGDAVVETLTSRVQFTDGVVASRESYQRRIRRRKGLHGNEVNGDESDEEGETEVDERVMEAEDREIETLKDVSIVGCDGFQGRHALAMTDVFGRRFRIGYW